MVRKLKGRDFVETKKRMQNDLGGDFETINMSVATTIDGKAEPPEFYLDDLFQDDYAKLIVAFASLNFNRAARNSLCSSLLRYFTVRGRRMVQP